MERSGIVEAGKERGDELCDCRPQLLDRRDEQVMQRRVLQQ